VGASGVWRELGRTRAVRMRREESGRMEERGRTPVLRRSLWLLPRLEDVPGRSDSEMGNVFRRSLNVSRRNCQKYVN
jgi:hypothetical protein